MAVMFWVLLVICLLAGWWEKVTGDCETFCICVVANQKGTVDRIRGRTCSYLISLCAPRLYGSAGTTARHHYTRQPTTTEDVTSYAGAGGRWIYHTLAFPEVEQSSGTFAKISCCWHVKVTGQPPRGLAPGQSLMHVNMGIISRRP